MEERCEEPTSPTLHMQGFSASEGQAGHMLLDSDEKHKITYICKRAKGNVQECNDTGEKAPSSLKPEAELHEPKTVVPCQSVCKNMFFIN